MNKNEHKRSVMEKGLPAERGRGTGKFFFGYWKEFYEH